MTFFDSFFSYFGKNKKWRFIFHLYISIFYSQKEIIRSIELLTIYLYKMAALEDLVMPEQISQTLEIHTLI